MYRKKYIYIIYVTVMGTKKLCNRSGSKSCFNDMHQWIDYIDKCNVNEKNCQNCWMFS